MPGFILNEPLHAVDPDVEKIIELESVRQQNKLILIPSESSAPFAVRESLGSVLQNIYAEGYPPEESRQFSQEEIINIEQQLAHYHRYSDPRYYKGVEFADIVEELARRRCAELFANDLIGADDIFVNVQPLSGAPANNAVYHALIEPGDTILGMNLFHGGHLTHGSSVNRSGKLYRVFHYSVDPLSEQIDYAQVHRIAQEAKPRVIIAGYSSYPWSPNWKEFRKIADSVGAYLLADISHIAGMIAAGVLPSPVGLADVITFTTHKTLCGPRGACILSFKENISKKIDKAVFPGEQGGPHIQVFAAMATTFYLARQKPFIEFQKQIVKNCLALSKQFQKRGLRVAYGGTNTHLLNLDCKTIKGADDTTLTGDMAARILDISGLVANSNAIPGDKSALRASGIRLGTPWITQRGLVEADMLELADIISDLFDAIKPYSYHAGSQILSRAKVDFKVFEKSKIRVKSLVEKTLASHTLSKLAEDQPAFFNDQRKSSSSHKNVSFLLQGENILQALDFILASDLETLLPDQSQPVSLFINNQLVNAQLTYQSPESCMIAFNTNQATQAAAWLRGLSDGYIRFDDDLFRRIPGPFSVTQVSSDIAQSSSAQPMISVAKPFFIGLPQCEQHASDALPSFHWESQESETIKRTPLHQRHIDLGAKMIPFAGWDMPVWYSSVLEEHLATRNHAGLFDVAHMGIYQAEGSLAVSFLDSVCANDISALAMGESCYTHFLDADANVIDDLLVYRHDQDKYLLVVNAANDDKDWAWLNAVRMQKVKIDNQRPWAHTFGSQVNLLNLRDPQAGKAMRVDIALQGPRSKEILNKIGLSLNHQKIFNHLKRTQLAHVLWNGIDLIISRTGYTGEKIAFEIFIHPEHALELWDKLIEVGTPLGLKPCGLGARDSLRTEAGLPLYGHEMGGEMNLGVGQAGFSAYVKTYKPWFIGRHAFMEKEAERKNEVCRFRFDDKRVRMAHYSDPVLNEKGKVIGVVTSCAIDKEEYLTGQALIEKTSILEGTPIYIIQNSQSISSYSPADLKPGEKIQLPDKAAVISRFPKL